jgi:ubiquinone/menaquinone biosynthesis C-methylase UbiE
MNQNEHNENIKEQFSKQAKAYSTVKAHSDALDTLIELTQVSERDRVLDVACGSGIISCEFAKYAKWVKGVDITPNMLMQARELQAENNLTNIDWILDDVLPLKFNDNSFSIVVTRFSFHHFMNYKAVFDEMIRVNQASGTILLIDVVLPSEKVNAYDEMEKLRDSSHVGALTIEKAEALFQNKKIKKYQKVNYCMEIELETQLDASCLNDEDKRKLRLMIIQDINKNSLGVNVTLKEDKFFLYYPISIYMAQKK